jgi:futalosine hydrolase
MNIAIVAATEIELMEARQFRNDLHGLQFHCHGIGLVSAVYHLQQIANSKPDLIIQCGIAGSFDERLAIGKTVLVSDEITDLGAEENDHLLDIFDLELVDKNIFPYHNGRLPCPFLMQKKIETPQVQGLTVNCSSGTDLTIKKRKEKFNASIETMEGAALHYVGLMGNISFLQVRTISNLVEKRNKSNWDVSLALKNNALDLMKILQQL